MNRVLFSRQSDEWSTPGDLYRQLDAEFHFDYDPCPLGGAFALMERWGKRVFCNPPYSDIRSFMEKGVCELQAQHSEVVVYLLPSRTGTSWFHDYCLTASEIRFLRGRLKFGGSKRSAPFDSMIVICRASENGREWGTRGGEGVVAS